jgi:hypothetical protein
MLFLFAFPYVEIIIYQYMIALMVVIKLKLGQINGQTLVEMLDHVPLPSCTYK